MVGPGTYEMPVQQMISGTVVANSLRNGKTVGFVAASDRFNAAGGCFNSSAVEFIPGPGQY